MKTTTKTTKTLCTALALASALFTLAPSAQAHAADRRGAVEVRGHAVKAVTVGPALVHGYSGFPGGALFVAPLATGTDADCAAALGSARPMTLVADRMAYVSVGSGQIACLVTQTSHPFELLWHAFETTPAPSETYIAHGNTRSTVR